jgi:F-type H+-transporting ATPase subunit delta
VQGVSRSSLSGRRDDLARRAGDLDRGGLLQLSDELYAVVGVLAGNYGLRRSLSDPSVGAEAKQRVVDSLLSGKIADTTLGVVKDAVGADWSQPRDLVDAIEILASDAALIAAQNEGNLDEVEDELFRFSRILTAEPQLRSALSDIGLPADRKRQLLDRLLSGKASEVTIRLLSHAVITPRGRTIERAISDISELAASRRERLIARVTSAVELSGQEQQDLAAALARVFGQELYLQLVVDPSLLGGLSVRIGDEVIDATVARQLDEARRRLTSGGTGRRRA